MTGLKKTLRSAAIVAVLSISGANVYPSIAALGGSAGYNFKIGDLPVSTRVKVYREFDVQNRLRGTAGYFTFSLPLYVATPPTAARVASK